ncbi:MAG: indolepyruvate oxidoreductase subunit beta [Raoultibacter sp.]
MSKPTAITKNTANTTTVVLCGVGGQGTILAADLLARAAMEAGLQVKLSEIHGMAQRGGAVSTIVRFGTCVSSMVADIGCADYIVSFETTEALRNLPYLAPQGIFLVNDEAVKPLPVATGAAAMPAAAPEKLRAAGAVLIPAGAMARAAGSAKSTNVVLIGALAAGLDFDCATWEAIIAAHVPQKTIETNIAAFRAGFAFVKGATA